jgi:hypothetical protein
VEVGTKNCLLEEEKGTDSHAKTSKPLEIRSVCICRLSPARVV